jgi:hypothetical protein
MAQPTDTPDTPPGGPVAAWPKLVPDPSKGEGA